AAHPDRRSVLAHHRDAHAGYRRSLGHPTFCSGACSICARARRSRLRGLSGHPAVPPQPFGCRLLALAACLSSHRLRDRHACRAWLLGVRLQGISGKDARGGLGSMTPRLKRLRWFGGLYLASLVALALTMFMVRAILSLVA